VATGTLVSVDEYLNTAYRPDCDYVEGRLLERNVGEHTHGRFQGRIFAWLLNRESVYGIEAVVEVRVRITSTRYRIPDVMVLSGNAPREEVIATPPLLCIEILSPSDTLAGRWERSQDYLTIGVPVCWIIDPLARHGWVLTSAGMSEPKDGIMRAGEIEMPLAEVLE
jgi:Uma2 family endonuclease